MKTLTAESVDLRAAIAEKPKGRGLFRAWQQARSRKAAADELILARKEQSELGIEFNAVLAEAKSLRAEKLAASPKDFKDGWRGWGRHAAELEMAAVALDVKAGEIHNYFAASCDRVNSLAVKAGESSAAHESELRRRKQAALEATAALAAYEAQAKAGEDQQKSLEVLDAPPV